MVGINVTCTEQEMSGVLHSSHGSRLAGKDNSSGMLCLFVGFRTHPGASTRLMVLDISHWVERYSMMAALL